MVSYIYIYDANRNVYTYIYIYIHTSIPAMLAASNAGTISKFVNKYMYFSVFYEYCIPYFQPK